MVDSNQNNATSPSWEKILLSVLDVLKSGPGLILLLCLWLHSPIYAVATALPDILGRANVITIGQLDIKLNAALADQASPSVRIGLKGLDAQSARRLLQLSDPNEYCVEPLYGDHDEVAQNLVTDEQLQALNMVTLATAPDMKPSSPNGKCYQVQATDLGKKTQNLLLTILTNALTTKPG